MIFVNSHTDLLNNIKEHPKTFVLIYKSGSEASDCAFNSLQEIEANYKGKNKVLAVDVNKVKDIHENYAISSAPSLLIFNEGELNNVVKGCMDSNYYSALLNETQKVGGKSNRDPRSKKRVIVYSTPTCSWCTRIKEHLRANNIQYREIDVAANPDMAEEMKRKSGQMGVPQTEINGQMIVGFDRPKIDKLLEIA